MAELSDQLMAFTVLAYVAAMVCYAAEYAFGTRSHIGRAVALHQQAGRQQLLQVDRDGVALPVDAHVHAHRHCPSVFGRARSHCASLCVARRAAMVKL